MHVCVCVCVMAPHSHTKPNVENMQHAFLIALLFNTQQEYSRESANVQHCSPSKAAPGWIGRDGEI